jgi:hypothetical protein
MAGSWLLAPGSWPKGVSRKPISSRLHAVLFGYSRPERRLNKVYSKLLRQTLFKLE